MPVVGRVRPHDLVDRSAGVQEVVVQQGAEAGQRRAEEARGRPRRKIPGVASVVGEEGRHVQTCGE
jgi:hypothetical protein